MTISAKDFDTVEQARLATETVQVKLTASEVATALVTNELFEYFVDGIGTLQRLVANSIERNAEFDFRDKEEDGQLNLIMFQALIDAEADTDIKVKLENLRTVLLVQSNVTTYPLANLTQAQFNNIKGLVTYIPVPNAGRNSLIKVTLNAPLDEKVLFSAYSKFNGCDYQNLGKHVQVQSNEHSYLIDLAGVQVRGDVFIRVPFPEFSCEVEAL